MGNPLDGVKLSERDRPDRRCLQNRRMRTYFEWVMLLAPHDLSRFAAACLMPVVFPPRWRPFADTETS